MCNDKKIVYLKQNYYYKIRLSQIKRITFNQKLYIYITIFL